LVFVVAGLMFLPSVFGFDGVWLTIPFAELVTILFSVWLIIKYKNEYGY
jgi:Na+-driven multidrug efflux pump